MPSVRLMTRKRTCTGVEQPPQVQQPPPQPLQQQPQKPAPTLLKSHEIAGRTPVSGQMTSAVVAGAKTPPVVSSAVAAWIAATPTIAPASAADLSLECSSRMESRSQMQAAMPCQVGCDSRAMPF